MAHSSNSEPRRFWKARHAHRDRSRCASCGARATFQGAELSLCGTCLDLAQQDGISEYDELGTID